MKDPIDHDSDTKGSQARDKSVSDLSVRSLVIQSLAVTMLFGLLHFFMGWILRYWGVWLPPGIGPDTVPVWAVWAPLLPNEWFLIAIVAFVWFIRVVPRLIKYQESPLLVLAILAGGYCLLSTVSILIRGPGWNLSLMATFHSHAELLQSPFIWGHYYPDSFFEGSVRDFLREYPQRMGDQTLHNTVHPPGGILVLRGVQAVWGDAIWSAALVRTLFAAGCVIPIYGMGRDLFNHQAGLIGAALWVLSPAVLMHSGTSAEPFFALPVLLSMWMFSWCFEIDDMKDRKRRPAESWKRSTGVGILAGMMLFVASMMTFSVAMIAVLFSLSVVRRIWIDRSRWIPEGGALLVTGLTCVVALTSLYLLTGFNYAESLLEAIQNDREALPWKKDPSLSYQAMVGTGNLSAFLLGTGMVSLCWWFRCARHRHSKSTIDRRENPFGKVLPVILLFFSYGRFYSLETERIWIFLIPIITVSVGYELTRCMRGERGMGLWYATAWILALQVWGFRLLFAVGTSQLWGFPGD